MEIAFNVKQKSLSQSRTRLAIDSLSCGERVEQSVLNATLGE